MSLATEQLVTAGVQCHEAGSFAEARAFYQQALAADPENADVLSLLGAVCINLQDWVQAAAYLNDALRVNPQHAAAHDNLGVLFAKQNRMAEATESFGRAAMFNPGNAQTWRNLARALPRAGRPAEAIEPLRRIASLEPNCVPAHADLAKALLKLDRVSEAVVPLRQVARLQPHDARAHFELAATLARCGQVDEAIAAYRETLTLKPDSAEAYVNLSHLYITQGSYDEAVGAGRRAVELRPNFAEAYLNLSSAYTKLGKYTDAVAASREAVRLNPQLSEAYNNLGIALAEEGNCSEATDHYRRALELCPDNPDALYNYGIAVLRQGDPVTAIEWFDRALQLSPDYGEAHHNRAAALLLSGRLAKGFEEYEWRFRSRDFPPFRARWPLWDGRSLEGRTIVLCAEQGMGDTLQFVRYAATLKARGARVIVECGAALHPILARTPGVDAWITPRGDAPQADCCLPMMSLPYRMGTLLDTIPAEVPYIFADPELIESWRQRLEAAGWRPEAGGRKTTNADEAHNSRLEFPGPENSSSSSSGPQPPVSGLFRIGIVWQGNPKCPGDARRSIPLSHFEALAKLRGVRLFSLQKGPGSEQLGQFREAWPVVDFESLDEAAGPFMDTAAIMKHLDLVITSDTAAAHLAGALGVPVWVALQFVPDWRWLVDRPDTPWYPTMRLFRQSWPGDWDRVFEQIAAVVGRLAAARS